MDGGGFDGSGCRLGSSLYCGFYFNSSALGNKSPESVQFLQLRILVERWWVLWRGCFGGRTIDLLRLRTFEFHKIRSLRINSSRLLVALRRLWNTAIFPSNSRFPRLCAKCLLKLKRLVSILPMIKSKKCLARLVLRLT